MFTFTYVLTKILWNFASIINHILIQNHFLYTFDESFTLSTRTMLDFNFLRNLEKNKCYKITSVASQYLDYRPRVHTVQREGHLVLVRLPGPGRHLALLPLPVPAAQLGVLLQHVLLGDVQQHGLGAVGAPTCGEK